ncbi:esterase/lipase family protein [Candidatus Uabimicrobium amorphum]|uniref:GPI inositol-deacylase PGAP1-like alpha/beta domain-containing protein n=1 Tax=Uabimicrobium amorphum TaxID=2596890 RepID=A0A5S9INU7_UABAM|nr:hypothetical protein [Candidatus Uabimicrobium amorphum]BBM84742.1 hypothetical protein UABAM_03103 [Candidatus Uabimicrobium amorphum]
MKCFVWIFCCVLLIGCSSSPIEFKPTTIEESWQDQQSNVLNSQILSPQTQQQLRIYLLTDLFLESPGKAIVGLQKQLINEKKREVCLAVAELYYDYANKSQTYKEKIKYYTESMKYSYFYMFDKNLGEQYSFDTNFKLIADIYNQSLTKCVFLSQKQKKESPTLFLRTLNWPATYHGFSVATENIQGFLFANQYKLTGMNNVYETYGLGVPLILLALPDANYPNIDEFYLDEEQSYPATIFARIQGSFLEPENVDVHLEFHNSMRASYTEVEGQKISLQTDITKPFAHSLGIHNFHEFELSSIFNVEEEKIRLFMSEPYTKEKIPVLLIHGLYSSPLTWLQMANDLRGDPYLREKYQFWFFVYPTGNPFPISAAALRQKLETLASILDPDKNNTSFQKMVLIGHSMGGLLTRLNISESRNHLWKMLSERDFSEVKKKLPEEVRGRVEKAVFFKPQYFVKRAVFIATPHRGSAFGHHWLSQMLTSFIKLPGRFLEGAKALNKILLLQEEGIDLSHMNSISSLSSKNPIFKAIEKMRIDIPYHSIIGNTAMDSEEEYWTDGVVAYQSSRMENAVSEKIVPYSHGCTSHPVTIQEVKRILKLHYTND